MAVNSRVALVVLSAAALGTARSQPATDESLRLIALRSIFPGMQVSPDYSKKLNDSWPNKPKPGEIFFPDTLSGESVYRVVGEPSNEAERCASDDVIAPGVYKRTREVRFRLIPWPREHGDGLLAVVQYRFPKANPAMSCPSIGLVVHLVKYAQDWNVTERYLLDTVHHGAIEGIRLLNFTGDGADLLVIESDSGGAGTLLSILWMFDLSGGRFNEVLETDSRFEYMTDDSYIQVLDFARTRESRGQQFCFTKTAFLESGKAFRPPRITHPCYKRGEGVDARDSNQRNKMLAPRR